MQKSTEKSREQYERASKLLAGGVNSPVRSFKAVNSSPLFIDRGEGAVIIDVDGNEYVDYVVSWGAGILGHAHPKVVNAVVKAASKGLSFGAPTERETQLAEVISELFPCMAMMRMVNSGTEAAMSAIRLARFHAKRNRIIKFDGCYHGHADALLGGGGSGIATFGVSDSPGVPRGAVNDTLVLPYNDSAALAEAFAKYRSEIAGVIVEPIAGNMGFVRGNREFLETMRELCDKVGSMLIYDEVMTGFRVAAQGAQSLFDIKPDMTILGKVAGGGLPFGAFGGAKALMRELAPCGPVYQAGTLSGNPLVTAAGLETISLIKERGFFERLTEKAGRLCIGLSAAAAACGVPFNCAFEGGMFGFFFSDAEVVDYDSAKEANDGTYARFHKGMLRRGIYLPPSPFEACFLSAAHEQQHIDKTIAAAAETFKEL